RHRIPSMSLRLACSGGRPRLPPGSSGPSTAHCASVRSARLVTAKVATRSPCRWSSLSLTHLPETSAVPGQRHAGLGQLKPLSPLLKHALVAIVAAAEPAERDGDSADLAPEDRRILGSCRQPVTVADVAAATALPLG